ncbi:MAG: helix-turn-helix domain-containing protein [Methanothrix sp.]|nr:helix-turn-helix domain-containing protein [Methanothrix sp.]
MLDPVELLDILGNENRRRILQLLSFRPFYFNEMAKRLDVGPKAVIDHLEMLEKAGLVECYQDRGRRKYFRIARKTVLEVALSPHSYGVRAYLCEDIPQSEESADSQELVPCSQELTSLKDQLAALKEKRRKLRTLLDQVDSEEMAVKQKACQAVRIQAASQLDEEILAALLSGDAEGHDLAMRLEIPEIVVEDRLRKLEERGAVHLSGRQWSLG